MSALLGDLSDPRFELLWWHGCPSHGEALELFRDVLDEVHGHGSAITRVQVLTPEDAASEGFVGSPTFRMDGRDLFPPEQVVPALTCRMYFRSDGRPSRLPDRARLVGAIIERLTDAPV